MTAAETTLRPVSGRHPGHHLLTLRVENRAGVLVRVAGLFSRRGFNIFSLAVAPTDDDRFSRISIVVDAESTPLQQILSQIDKLINVVEITELHPDNAREVELLLATVQKGNDHDELVRFVIDSGGSVIDESAEALTVTVAAAPSALDEIEAELAKYGIVELQRTGRIALPKLVPVDPANAE